MGVAPVMAQTAPPPPPPTEQYLRVCETINRADQAFAAKDTGMALAAYREAGQALEAFRRQHPGWNTLLVDVRTQHVGSRVKVLEQNPAAAASLSGAAPAQSPAPPELAMPPSADITNDFRLVLQELRAAESDNALLLAKLREALTSTPALMDPRELERAEQRIGNLKSENDQLRLRLESAAAPSAAASTTTGSAETKRLRREIEDLNRKLKAQAAAAVQLLAEKTVEMNRQADQLAALKGQMSAGASSAMVALEQENAALKQQLQAATVVAASAQAATAQLAAAQNQLAEAKGRIEGLQSDLARRPAGPTAADLERVTSENRSLRQELETLRQRSGSQDEKLAAATARANQAEEASRQLQAARTELASLQQSRTALEQQLAAAPKPEAVGELRSRNEDLQRQLADATARLATAEARAAATPATLTTPAELAALRQRAEAAEAGAKALHLENAALSQQADDARRRAAAAVADDSPRVRELEAKLRDLEQRLAAADRQLAAPSSPKLEKRLDALNTEVVALRSRLNVYETKAVPYTKAELTLFIKPAATDVVAQKSLPAKSSRGMTAELQTRGEKQLAAGDLPQAEQTLTQVVTANEKEIRGLCNLANAQAGQGKLPEADATIQRALASAPNDAACLAVLGYIRYSQGRADEALSVLSRAAMLKPKDPGIQVLLGVTLAEKGLRPQAETAFRKALQLQPNHADAHRNLAVIYVTQKPPRVELARWHYQKAVAAGSPPSADFERELETVAKQPTS